MNISYVRQISEFSKYYYLDHPDQFDIVPPDLTCYKNFVFLTTSNPREKQLYVFSAGYEVSDVKKQLINRNFPTRITFHYIVGGEGTFNGRPIKAGDCVIAFQNQPHSLCTNPKNTLRFYWVMVWVPENFDPTIWGIDPSCEIFSYGFEDRMKEILERMLHFYSEEQDPYYFYLSQFYELLSYHRMRTLKAQLPINNSPYKKYISLAKRMWEETFYTLSVTEVAKSLGYSRKYFSRIFFNELGISPQKYLFEHKMRLAKSRIQEENINLKNLAFQLGYENYPSFSRAFKNHFGINPQDLQKEKNTEKKK